LIDDVLTSVVVVFKSISISGDAIEVVVAGDTVT
jgi:hypothetical protein